MRRGYPPWRRRPLPTPAAKRVWNDLEIKVVGPHHTVVRNGVTITELENVPGLPLRGRPNDPGWDSRGPVRCIGLRAHGGENDVASFRDIRVRGLSGRD